MAWLTGTATDYRDMLDQVIEIATSDHVASVDAFPAGGSGFAVDDLVTFTDGTFTSACILRVTAVSSGAITAARVEEAGAYTVDPDLTANSSWTTSGSGTGATFDLTMESEPWTVERRAQEAVSAVVFGGGGTGYAVSDKLTVDMNGGGVLGADGETYYGVAPIFNVDTVGGSGEVTAVSLDTAGHLEEVPDVDGTAGSQCDTTGGTGSGCQLTVTYQDVAATQEDVVILSGPGEGGTDQILVGIRTFQKAAEGGFDTAFNWQLFGMTEFNSSLALHDQINISYGADASDGTIELDGGSFMVLKENDADPDISFWISVTNRRIILVAKVETASTIYYPQMYVGFLDAFSTTNEEPYPIWIQGCTSRENSWWGDTAMGRISGLTDMYRISSRANGPAQYRADAGDWKSFANGTVSDTGSPTRSATSDFLSFPSGLPTFQPQTDDQISTGASSGVDMQDIIPSTGVPGTPNYLLRPTPNTGDDVRPMLPITPMSTDNPTTPTRYVYAPIGELNNCFWISASDAGTDLSSEDVQKVGDDRYIVFQNGNQDAEFRFTAIKAE